MLYKFKSHCVTIILEELSISVEDYTRALKNQCNCYNSIRTYIEVCLGICITSVNIIEWPL